MHFHKLLKSAVCAALVVSLSLTMGANAALTPTMGQEEQLAGLSVLIDQTHNQVDVSQAVLESADDNAAAVTSGAISVNEQDTEEKKEKKSRFADKGISIAEDYVCIRSEKSTDSEIRGKLNRGSIATIIKKAGSWVKVESGDISGYVKKEYLAIGKDAEKISEKYTIKKAKVQTETLMVREQKSTDAKILTMVGEEDTLKVLKEGKEWVKIKVDDTTGYVSADYVNVKDTFEKAEKMPEPESSTTRTSRLTSSGTGTSSTRRSTRSYSKPASNGSSKGASIASYALQFVGNPYVYGGTSLTNGADCSGFTQSVFRKFGISIPRTSGSQTGVGRAVSASEARAGDLVFYARNGRINHVALCIGGGRVVHASNPSTGIRTSNLYYRNPVAVRRIV